MTISDFLKLPNFTDLRLLAGKDGLLSEVTNVTVVDTPDGTNWLNGGELVITTAYMLHEEKDLLEFLRTLSSKKAAGVGIKENRYLTEIPESARKLADEDSPLMRQLQDMDMENISSEFLNQYDNYAVANKNESFGYLLFEKGRLDTGNESSAQIALEYASIVLILHSQVRIANQQMAEKYKASFLEDLLLNNVKADIEIHNRARLYGWDFTNGGLAAVVDINNIKKYFIDRLDSNTNRMLEEATELIFRNSIHEMHQTFPQAKYFRQSDLIVFIISVPKDSRELLADQLEQTFKRLQSQLSHVSPFTITLGIGQYYENIREISKSYSEARVAINLGYSLQWFDRILFYNRLGLYRLLAPVMNSPESEELCLQYIKPLEDYDKKYHGELLSTLQEILQCGWNLKESAEKLYIHYNSIKYRYSKICKVLNLDLSDHDNRSLVEIAMKLYRLKHYKKENQ